MSENKSETGKNFLVQGSILAIAGVITKIIGAVYRIPLVNILGDKGMGYYGVAFQIYAIALTLTSYSLPLAVSKLVSARLATGQYKNAYRVFRGAMTFAIAAGGIVGAIIFFGAVSFATIGSVHSDRGNPWCIPWIFPGKWIHGSDGCFPDHRTDCQCSCQRSRCLHAP